MAMEFYGLGKSSVSLGLNYKQRADAMMCFAVMFCVHVLAAIATHALLHRRLTDVRTLPIARQALNGSRHTHVDLVSDAVSKMWREDGKYLCAVSVQIVVVAIRHAALLRADVKSSDD